MKITLLQWHPYSNRQFDKRTTLSGYLSGKTEGPGYQTFLEENFEKGDGVNTVKVINYPIGMNDDYEYDYLLVSSDDPPPLNDVSVPSNDVISRWYIIESNWDRELQRTLTLKRDLVADTWDDIKGDDFYCEKGLVPKTDYFILQNEPLEFNQVLVNRTTINDTYDPNNKWAVGFVANNTKAEHISFDPYPRNTTHDFPFGHAFVQGYSRDYNLNYGEIPYVSNVGSITESYTIDLACGLSVNDGLNSKINCIYNFATKNFAVAATTNKAVCAYGGPYATTVSQVSTAANNSKGVMPDLSEFEFKASKAKYWDDEWDKYNNYIYYDTINEGYYKVKITKPTNDPATKIIEYPANASEASYTVKNIVENIHGQLKLAQPTAVIYHNEPIEIYNRCTPTHSFWAVHVAFEKVTPTGIINFDYPAQGVGLSSGEPYNIFFTKITNNNIKILMQLGSELASKEWLYDYQLFPYCPVSSAIELAALTTTTIDANTTIYWAKTNKRTITATMNNPCYSGHTMTDAEVKWHNISTFVRFQSPDESASFDFYPTKNGDWEQSINLNVKFSLIPFNSVIHIYPDWGGLYGPDVYGADTNRGLIYKGDFSFPRSTNQWENYKTNNKSYLDAFNRQIDNMEYNHKWGMAESGFSAITNTAGRTATGTMAGGIAGGIIGGVTSGVAGIVDQIANQAKFNESLDYTKDQFKFNIANIQARANTLTTSGTSTITNYVWPFIETYMATNDEKTEWEDYQYYNAWTVNKIETLNTMAGRVSNISKFVKGYLCRCSLHDDAHFTNALNDELKRGVYIE